MKYRLPLREIVVDFYNELKSITSGYASFDYEDSEYVFSFSLLTHALVPSCMHKCSCLPRQNFFILNTDAHQIDVI